MMTDRTFNFDPVPPSAGASSTSVLVVLAMLSAGCATTDPSRLQVEQSASQVSVFTASGQQVLLYHLRPPPGTKLVVEIFLSSKTRHTRFDCDWSSDVCSSD